MGELKMQQKQISTTKIIPNKNNPRGINVAQDDDKLSLLMDSIDIFGVMVPLVVAPRGEKYLLIDGERRYEASKRLGLKKVPAYVAEEGLNKEDILLRMFHLHHNREQWGPIPQCKALESMYDKIKNQKKKQTIKDEEKRIKAIATEIENRTGLTNTTARDRVLFLRWPQDIKEELYEVHSEAYHYIIEIENRIILPALKNYPEYFDEVPVDDVRRFLLQKYKVNTATRGVDARLVTKMLKFKTHKKRERDKVLKIFSDLVEDENMTYNEAREDFNRQFPSTNPIKAPSPKKLLTSICALFEKVEMFEINSFPKKTSRNYVRRSTIIEAIEDLLKALKDLRGRLKNHK